MNSGNTVNAMFRSVLIIAGIALVVVLAVLIPLMATGVIHIPDTGSIAHMAGFTSQHPPDGSRRHVV